MIVAGLIGLMMGALLGLRLRVLVLLPVEAAALAAAALAVLTGAASGFAALGAFVLFSASLQAAYMAALALLPSVRRPATHPAEA